MKISSVVVVSAAVPGRARLHVRELRRQPALAFQLRDRLGGDDRIHHVRASAVTGNVLMLFDAVRLDLDEVRRRVAHEAATYRPLRGPWVSEGYLAGAPPATDGPAWHTQEAAEVIGALNPNGPLGLSGKEAEDRLAVSGPNRLPAPQPKSGLEMIWEQVGSLPVLLLGA